MDAAAQNAFKADDLAAGLSKVAKNKAKLKDAERLLCTVAMLKQGLCSTSAPHKPVSVPARRRALRRRALRLREPRKPVLQPVLGRTPSSVYPNVVGAMQEASAKKAAEVVDQRVVEEALKAGEKLQKEQAKEEAKAAKAAAKEK